MALWERLCGVPGIWQQTLCELGVDSVQQLALLAALNEAFGQDRASLTLQTLKAHPSPSRLYQHWLVRRNGGRAMTVTIKHEAPTSANPARPRERVANLGARLAACLAATPLAPAIRMGGEGISEGGSA